MTLLRDEIKDRVAQGIAAVGNERCRLIHDNCPAWYALHIFRYMEKYGVVCVGGHYGMGFVNSWGYTEDGRLKAIKTVGYPGWQKPRNREDWNEAQVMNRIDSFMESLGLSKLED